jgi:hypothetical protein
MRVDQSQGDHVGSPAYSGQLVSAGIVAMVDGVSALVDAVDFAL